MPTNSKKRLGEMLLEAGVIDETQLLSALGHQRKWGGKLGQALLDLRLATEPQVVSALARKYGYEVANVAGLQRSPPLEAALKLVPREIALRQTLLPIAADTATLSIAMGDPTNIAAIDELSFRTGRRVKVALAGDREIGAAVRRLYYAEDEKGRVEPISLDEETPTIETPLETTRDPFMAMPDHIRDGYFRAPAPPEAPARPPAPRSPPPAAARPAPPPRAPPPPPTPAPSYEAPAFTPPPVLLPSAAGAPFDDPQAAGDLPPGEPILATDLLVEEDGPVEGPPPGRALSPKEAALLEILDRLARGDDAGLLPAGRLAAAMARVLLRRGLLSEAELLEELARRAK